MELLISIFLLFLPFVIGWFILSRCLRIFFSPIISDWISAGFIGLIITSVALCAVLMKYGILDPRRLDKALAYSALMSVNIIILPALYWYDKSQSKKDGAQRIPENVLHSFAFVGGAVGAIASQRLFRHKTMKSRFQLVTYCSLVSSLYIFYKVIFAWV